MPFIPNTPEARLGRSDSKNPETTCRGITSSGRPCRRPLNASPSGTPEPPRTRVNQLRADDPSDPDSYCWQHRDQASLSAKSSPGPGKSTTPILETRESIDTLIGRLGIVEAQQQSPSSGKNGRKTSRPSVGSQHNSNNNNNSEKISHHTSTNYEPPRPEPKRREITFCCCFKIPIPSFDFEQEEERPTRPHPRPLQTPPSSKPPTNQHLAPSSASGRPGTSPPPRKSTSAYSTTSQYMALIPPTASPQTASQLMAELAKPISQQDEPGYIYIFWLTPESQPATPPAEAARSLLAPPSRPEGGRQRRTSDVLEMFAASNTRSGPGSSSKKTVLLKIGRANNVQRRMNEWTRQCGYNLSLIRYYPYISSSQPSTPRKMPHSHKVERLIHLELSGAGMRVSDREEKCEACGRAHREWFEVEASRKGIEMVDEVVRRWSDWDEGLSA